MAFQGQRYQLALTGPWNANENIDEIPAGQLTVGSRNINTHDGISEKRGGTDLVGSLITNNPTCLGGAQLVKISGTKHNYFAGDNGILYRDGSSIQTGRNSGAKTNFTVADDKIFICNGIDDVKVDDGSSLATITTPATDWSGTDQPRKMIVHNKGASRRMFAWGVSTKKTTLYYSKLNDFEDWTDASAGTLDVDTGDGYGIINCVSKDGTLFIFGRNKTYILLDDNTDITTWGIIAASWAGGVHSEQLMVVANNDIYALTSNLEFYSVASAEQLRNYKRASITRPFFVNNYIDNNIDKTKLDNFHAIYDPKIKAIKLWVTRSSQTENDTCIIFDVDRQFWVPPHDAEDNTSDSGYAAAASWNAVNSNDEDVTYTGDYNGGTWELETDTKADNSNAFTSDVRTTWATLDLPGITKFFDSHWPPVIHFISRGDYQIDIRWFIDNNEQTSQSVSLGADSAALGSFVLGTDALGSIGLSKEELVTGAKGEKIRFYISNDGNGEDFALSHIIIPFLPLGIERIPQ